MTPIHHSKLKKGDLIYVESKGIMHPTKSHTLAEILAINYHGGWIMVRLSQSQSFIHPDYNDIFLIERGYFL